MNAYLASNRILYEEWEDRQYKMHLKKLVDIKKKTYIDNSEPLKFPHLSNNAKRQQQLLDRQNEIDTDMKALNGRMDRIKQGKSVKLDNWNVDYEKRRIHLMLKDKNVSALDEENAKISKRLGNARGVYNIKKWDRDFENHLAFSKLRKNKFYTPRGFGYRRKATSLPGSKTTLSPKDKEKDMLTLLHEALNQFERADIVLMKTLILLDYEDRLKTKDRFELKYNTDLKKGLIKVLDKEYEMLVNALLTDSNAYEVDRIYEALYSYQEFNLNSPDPTDAATVVTEALTMRNFTEKEKLLDAFKEKLDSTLTEEITEKTEGDLKMFLLALLENNNLDSSDTDESRAKSDVNELKKKLSLTSSLFLNILKTASRRQLKLVFETYQTITGNDICHKMDSTKPIVKAVKVLEVMICDPDGYVLDKLQKNIKANKSEFLRLFLMFDDERLKKITAQYKQKYNVQLEDDIKANFKEEISKLLLKRLYKHRETPSTEAR